MAQESNEALELIESSIQKLLNSYTAQEIDLSIAEFGQRLNSILNRKVEDKFSFIALAKKHLSAMKPTASKNTYQNYNQMISLLEEYAKFKGVTDWRVNDFTQDWYNDFLIYCTSQRESSGALIGKTNRKAKNLKLGSFGAHIQYIKAMLSRIQELDKVKLSVTDYKNKAFKSHDTYEDNKVHTNEAEIKQLYDLELPEGSKEKLVRDSYILRCWLGTRFGESKTATVKNKNIELYQPKTNKYLAIPIIHPMAEKILKEYNNTIPAVEIDNVTYNKLLKKIAKKAGLNRIEYERPIWAQLTTHSARRSLATNLLDRGFPLQFVMAIGGWKRESSFWKYMRNSSHQTAKVVQEFAKGIDWGEDA